MTVSVLLHCYTTAFTSVSPVNIINALHLFLIAAVTLVWRLYCSTARGECSCISGPSVICQADWPCLWEGELHTQLRQLFPHVLWEGNHFSVKSIFQQCVWLYKVQIWPALLIFLFSGGPTVFSTCGAKYCIYIKD